MEQAVEAEILSPQDMLPVVSIDREELDIQVVTAKRYPRDIKRFREESMSMALLDRETAASCFYVLKRRNKDGGEVRIEGKSVRLAEIVANNWRNLYCAERIIGETEDRKFVIGEGVAWDLERNVRRTVRVTRRISDKTGKRYSEDMIQVTGNAASSIAGRNAVFKVVPDALIKPIYEAAKKLAIGDAKSLVQRRQEMLAHFAKFGVGEDRLLAALGKPSVDSIDLGDIEELIGISTAIRDGDTKIDEAFPPLSAVPDEAEGSKIKNLAQKVREKRQAAKAKKETEAATPETKPSKPEPKPEAAETVKPEAETPAPHSEVPSLADFSQREGVVKDIEAYFVSQNVGNARKEAEKFIQRAAGKPWHHMTTEDVESIRKMIPK